MSEQSIVERYRRLVEQAGQHADDDLKKTGDVISTFQIMIGHFYSIGQDISAEFNRLQGALAAVEAREAVKDEALEHARHVMWEYGFSENDLQPVRAALDLPATSTTALEIRKKALDEAAQIARYMHIAHDPEGWVDTYNGDVATAILALQEKPQ